MHQTGRQIAVSGAEVLAASPASDMVVFQVQRERRTTGATPDFPSGTESGCFRVCRSRFRYDNLGVRPDEYAAALIELHTLAERAQIRTRIHPENPDFLGHGVAQNYTEAVA